MSGKRENEVDKQAVLLSERAKTHGPYLAVADLTMLTYHQLTDAMRSQPRSDKDDVILFTVFNISHKLVRAMSGKATEIDHWRDIAGYATRLVEELEKDTNKKG